MKTQVIGLTGGIGSGKSTVARMFNELGVPVYYADDEARNIFFLPEVVEQLIDLFGQEILTDGVPDRAKVAAIVFTDKEKLAGLNAIIHPRVGLHFKEWLARHNNDKFVLKEAAILFESGSYTQCDAVILVTSPIEIRISRVMQRDGVSRDKVEQRIANQWTEEEKQRLSQYTITNISIEDTREEVSRLFDFLNKIEK